MRIIKVGIPGASRGWPFVRQTPGSSARWGDAVFLFDEHVLEADYLVVLEGLSEPIRCRCDPARTLLMLMEPPTIRRYDPRFAAQFAKLVTVHQDLPHPNKLVSQPALPWHVGMDTSRWHSLPYSNRDGGRPAVPVRTYDDFKGLDLTAKTRELSVIASAKRFTQGHVKRIHFVQKLLDHFGAGIDLFGAGFFVQGRGHVDLADKMDGVAPYKYHIVIENSRYPNYFSEKLTDCLLCGALPFYYGCPNIHDYFPKDSVIPIDIEDPAAAMAIIEQAMAGDAFGRAQGALAQARELTLDHYNLFAVIERLCREPAGEKRWLDIIPEHLI